MKTSEPRDADFIGAALSLARRGLGNVFPNPAVGCILVKDGIVVGRGWTRPGGRPHAETVALAQAQDHACGATAYVSLEPCAHHGKTPPCAEALVEAGVARVVVAITDPDVRVAGRGIEILKAAGIEVVTDVRRAEAWAVNLGFFLSRTQGRPMFTLKLATDANGHIPIARAQGEDKWITSPQARARGHLLRANHDAVLFGIGTVLDDDPAYTCRLTGLEDQSPIRVLLDSHLRLPVDGRLLQTLDMAPLWVVCGETATGAEALESKGVVVIRAAQDRPDPLWVARELARRGITRVLIETGPLIATAFLEARLVDEVAWFRAARKLPEGAPRAFQSPDCLETLAFVRQAVLQAGPDRLELYVKRD